MLGAMCKADERVLLQIIGDGPLGRIVAESSPSLEVRGFVTNPHVHLPLNPQGKLAVGQAVGKGHLYVIRQTGLKTPYQGGVTLVSGEIADDLAYYFARSEQIPSVVSLGVLVNPTIPSAAGLDSQVLPGAEEWGPDQLEKQAQQLPHQPLIENGKTPEAIIHHWRRIRTGDHQ